MEKKMKENRKKSRALLSVWFLLAVLLQGRNRNNADGCGSAAGDDGSESGHAGRCAETESSCYIR